MMAPIMLVAVVIHAWASHSLPPVPSGVAAIVAALLAFAAPLAVRYERGHDCGPVQRWAAIGAVVIAPMFLFGLAMSQWSILAQGAGWQTGPAALVMIGMLVGVLCSGRLPTMVAALLSLWFAHVLVSLEPGTMLALVIGAGSGVYISFRQIELNRMAQDRLEQVERAQQRAELILSDYESTRQGWFWETDRRGLITYVSRTIGEIVGADEGELVGRPFTDLFLEEGQSGESERTLHFHLNARSSFQDLRLRAAALDGEERWWSVNGLPVYDDFDNFQGFRGSGSDLTERKRHEEQATRLAHYDSLTGLANRLQMSKSLEKILNARAVENRTCAVFLLDLDRFKQVNDTLGHPAGDALLRQVAQRLERVVESPGRVGRLGGDEFQVIIPGRSTRNALAHRAERIIMALAEPYQIDGNRVMIGASVGIAIAPDDGVTSEAIIRNADLALYAAKDGGRGRHHFYAPDLHTDAQERRQLEQDLRDALASGGLQLSYQPVVHTASEKIAGFEALLRWNHPTRGWLSPAKFVPIAEDAGIIAQIGEWALRTACQDRAMAGFRTGRGQCLAAAIRESSPAGHRHFGSCFGRGCPRTARTGDHRERVPQRRRGHRCDVRRPEASRRASGAGRFRHRLFLARLSEEGAVRQDQDRSVFRSRGLREGKLQRRDHRRDRTARRGAGDGNHRRGRGNARRARPCPLARLQPRSGLHLR